MKTLHWFLLVLLVISCRKRETDVNISGRVYDPDLQQYIASATVILSGNGLQSGVYVPGFSHIATTTTDASGNFSFTFVRDKADMYRLVFKKDMYFEKTIEFSAAVFDSSSEHLENVQLRPSGLIQVHLKNAYPSDDDDLVVFYFTNCVEECIDCCLNTPRNGYGPAFDTTFTCRFYGNKKINFLRSVTKDQQTNVFADSLFCPAFDTQVHEILY
jgi:hypothetical protein